MVEKEIFEGGASFRCEACGFHYGNRTDAEICEEFCEEKGICDSDITSRSLERSKKKK